MLFLHDMNGLPSNSGRNSVLYVEKDPDVCARIAKKLCNSGYKLFLAENTDDASRIFTEFNPDIVITESSLLSESDGLDLAREIKKKSPFVPVILTSENINPISLDSAVRCGVNSFISKPLDETHLVSLLEKYLPETTITVDIHSMPEIESGNHQFNALTQSSSTIFSPVSAEIEYRLLKRNSLLETVNRDLEEICEAISHDLRGPVARLQGYSSILQEHIASNSLSSSEKYVGKIDSTCKSIKRILDGLIQVSYYSRCSVVSRPVDLSAISIEVASSIRKAYPERKINFVISPDIKARGDENLIKLVIHHLFDNSVKFSLTSDDTRIIFGRASDEGKTVFFVRDNGSGFPRKYSSEIFKPFIRLNPQEESVGEGLGLSIVQRIIRRHGGRIWSDSEEGVGTTIYFTL